MAFSMSQPPPRSLDVALDPVRDAGLEAGLEPGLDPGLEPGRLEDVGAGMPVSPSRERRVDVARGVSGARAGTLALTASPLVDRSEHELSLVEVSSLMSANEK